MSLRSRFGSTRARLVPAAAGLLAGGLLLVCSAAPASALAQPTLTIGAPKPATVFSTTSVTISGTANFTADSLYHGSITSLTVTASFEGHTVGSCQNSGSSSTCGPTSGWSLALSGLDYNGPYTVAANDASSESLILTGVGTQTATNSASTSFSIAVKPAAPQHVTTTVNSDGSVTLTWDRNTEPDLLGYLVTGGSVGSNGADVKQPSSGSTVSWTDTGTTAGGSFNYEVTAIRPGADGKAGDALIASSGAVTASVPIPAPVTTLGGVTSLPGETTTTTVAQSTAPNLNAFLNQAAKAGISTAPVLPPVHLSIPKTQPLRLPVPVTSAGPPNTYDPTLPFGTARATPAGAASQQIALPSSSPLTHGQPLLLSVAGGLLLCVAGLALRKANRGKDPALEPLNDRDGGPPTGGTVAAGPSTPASALAKAAARAAAMGRQPPQPRPTSVPFVIVPPPQVAEPLAAAPAPAAEAPQVAGPAVPAPAAFAAAAPQVAGPAVPAPAAFVVAAPPVGGPAVDASPAPAAFVVAAPPVAGPAVGASPAPDASVGTDPESDPDRRVPALSAAVAAARADRDFGALQLNPAVDEAVDYFRLLK